MVQKTQENSYSDGWWNQSTPNPIILLTPSFYNNNNNFVLFEKKNITNLLNFVVY